MKKIYNSPEVEILEFNPTSALLSLSFEDDGRGYFDKQKDEGSRNDWDNIWSEM